MESYKLIFSFSLSVCTYNIIQDAHFCVLFNKNRTICSACMHVVLESVWNVSVCDTIILIGS